VSSKIGGNQSHFNAYLHNNSLLFQFILTELICAFRLIKEVNQLSNELKEDLHSNRSEEVFYNLKSCISKLAGSSQEYMRFFSWNNEDGALAKLKNNCAYFSQNSEYEEKDIRNLHRFAHKAWLLCLRALDMMRLIEHESLLDEPNSEESPDSHLALLMQTIHKVNLSIERVAALIVRLFTQFREDENVVFFLLRYKEQLNELYGTNFVFKLLLQMYPKGLKQASHFLLKKYAGRGFDNLLPIIASKISELEASQK
jgi:hypothetical protein